MAALLTDPILNQNFEIIRDQIGAILALELPNQATLTGETELDANIFIERFITPNHVELPLINIFMDGGVFNDQDIEIQDLVCSYNIDCYTSAKSSATDDGDSLALVKLQRLMGVIRSILHSTHYLTLGLSRPSISNRKVKSIQVQDPTNNKDAANVMYGRLILDVRFPESAEQFKSIPLADSHTQVKLHDTEKGMKYILESS